MTVPATAALAVWDLAIDDDASVITTWTRATAATQAGPGWPTDGSGIPVDLALHVADGAVEFNLAAADGTWSPLVSGWSPGAVRLAQIRLRTADDGTGATVQITETRAVF